MTLVGWQKIVCHFAACLEVGFAFVFEAGLPLATVAAAPRVLVAVAAVLVLDRGFFAAAAFLLLSAAEPVTLYLGLATAMTRYDRDKPSSQHPFSRSWPS
jgi:hypothetical protein